MRSKKGKKLTHNTFVKMLRNPVYIGQMGFRKWGTRKGMHEPLVSEPVFRNVQLILKGKKPIAMPYHLNHSDFPLRRFLRCSECNRPLTGGQGKSHTGKNYDYYHCYRCHAVKSLPAGKVAGEFLQLLQRLRVGEAFTTEFASILKLKWNKRTRDSTILVRKLHGDLKKEHASQEKFITKYLKKDPKIFALF